MNLAYLAGIIDGEGCIGFTRIRGQLVPRVTVTNTDRTLIEDLKHHFGGHISYRKPYKPGWKPSMHWILQNSKSVQLLDKVYKYLRIKKNQATCLFLHDSIRPGIGHKWTNEGKDACQLLEDQIKWLNMKGDVNDQEPMAIAYSEAREGKKRRKK